MSSSLVARLEHCRPLPEATMFADDKALCIRYYPHGNRKIGALMEQMFKLILQMEKLEVTSKES